MTKTMTAREFVTGKFFMKYTDVIKKEAYGAMKLAQSVSKSPTGKLYSTSVFNKYRAQHDAVDKALGDFNLAWNRVAWGKVTTLKFVARELFILTLSVEELNDANVRHEAMVASGFALMVVKLSEVMIAWIKSLPKQCEKSRKKLLALEKTLKKAQKDVSGAEIQRQLNLLISAVALCLAPVSLGASIAVAAGGFVAQTAIDAALGPGKPGLEGTYYTAVGNAAGIGDVMGKAGARLSGVAAAIGTLKLDTDEVAQAKAIWQKVMVELRNASADYDDLTALAMKMGKALAKHEANLRNAWKAYDRAAKKNPKPDKARKELLAELRKRK